jgi:NTF2 fold immunity protein of polymorphic toxin system component
LLPLFSAAQGLSKTEIEDARRIIKEALTNKNNKQILVDSVVGDKETAIAVAEPILFKIYGKDHILGEKPYLIELVDGYWLISGLLPKAKPGQLIFGDTFFIILSAKDGRVIKLVHYK